MPRMGDVTLSNFRFFYINIPCDNHLNSSKATFFGEQLRLSRVGKSGKTSQSRRILYGYNFMLDTFSRNAQNEYRTIHRSMVVFLVEAKQEFILMISI